MIKYPTASERDRYIAELEATIARVRKFAEEMEGWCSPHGVSYEYAQRLRAVLENKK